MDIYGILERKWVIPAVAGVASFGAGLGVGYILGRRKGVIETRIELSAPDVMEDDDPQLSLFDALQETGEDVMIDSKDLGEFVEDIHPGDKVEIVVNPEPTREVVLRSPEPEVVARSNIFERSAPPPDSHWDYEEELAKRDPGAPYVIHKDEFFADEMDYNQETLTYFAGDDIMADESDTPIYNYSNLMGELKFGHGSEDANIVYIRNDVLHMEWEILRHSGHFSVEVLGLEIEAEYEAKDLKHSATRRFRMDD